MVPWRSRVRGQRRIMDEKLTIFIAVTSAAVVLQMLILAGMYFAVRALSTHLKSDRG